MDRSMYALLKFWVSFMYKYISLFVHVMCIIKIHNLKEKFNNKKKLV